MKMFVILSHKLSEIQIQEINQRFKIDDIVYLPDSLQKIWSNIPPSGEWQEDFLREIKNWLSKQLKKGDKLIVQGEFGAAFCLVQWLKKRGYAVYYATTERKVIEEQLKDGTIRTNRIFQHVNFREYPQ
jgi:hypothetical protein